MCSTNIKAVSENVVRIACFNLFTIFLLAAILFFFEQYNFYGASIFGISGFSGLDLAFGLTIEVGRAGFFLFCFPVFLSITGVACSVVATFKKSSRKILLCTCMTVALISALIYLTTYFYEMSRYDEAKECVKWTFAFWGAFTLYCLAFFASAIAVFFNNNRSVLMHNNHLNSRNKLY